jgi:hypothetical protein
MQQKCRSNVANAQLELAVILRPNGGGPPVALGIVRDDDLLRAVLEKMIAQANVGAAKSADPLQVRACFAQARVLREYLRGIE